MNILVCIKQVPGTNKVEVDPVTGVLKRDGVDSKMNPYDLHALETALRLKEKHNGHVHVLSMGPPQAKQVIYEAFSMGADAGTLLTDRKFGGADVLATSYTLSQGVEKIGDYDLILCGKQTTDGDTAQVGPEMAEYLGIPSISNVQKILEITKESITVEMDMTESIEISTIGFPCLLTVEKSICEPRLPSYIKKMATKNKTIQMFSFADLKDQDENKYGLSGSPTQVQRIFPPDANDQRELWKGSDSEMATQILSKLKTLKFV